MINPTNYDSELYKKICTAFNSEFIGDIVFDEENELNEIKEYLRDEFNKKDVFISTQFFNKALVILIVNLSKRWGDNDNDSHFYKKIFFEIFGDENLELKNFKIKYYYEKRHMWLKDDFGKSTRYKQTFLYHAFAPNYSVNALIDIIYDIYTDDNNNGFFQDTYEEDPSSYNKITRAFSNVFKGIKEDVTSIDLYNHSYKLGAAARHGFTCDQQNMGILISRTVQYIKSFFKEEPILDGTYYSLIVAKHLRTVELSTPSRKKFIKKERVKSIKDWYAYYYLDIEKKTIYIKLPQLALETLDEYKNLTMKVFQNDLEISDRTRNVPIRGEEYNPHINEQEIDITRLIEKTESDISFRIEVYINNGEKCIFSTKDELIRDFLIFTTNSNRENKDLNICPNQYIQIILPKKLNSDFIDLKTIKKAKPINTDWLSHCWGFVAINNTSIVLGEKCVCFCDRTIKASCEIRGERVKRIQLETRYGKCDVYKSIKGISLLPSVDFINEKKCILEYINIKEGALSESRKMPFTWEVAQLMNSKIDLNSHKYNFLKQNGLNILTFKSIDGKRKLSSIHYFVKNLSIKITKPYVNLKGLVKITIIDKDEDENLLLESIKRLEEKNVYLKISDGTLICTLPYLIHELLGVRSSEKILLKNKNCKNLYKDEILNTKTCFVNIENKLHKNIKVFNNGNEISSIGNKYPVLKIDDDAKSFYEISVKDDGIDYPIYRIYMIERILGNDIAIYYENYQFYYEIHGFIGRSNPHFKFVFSSEKLGMKKIFESKILDDKVGNFQIHQFVDGYYSYEIYLMNYVNCNYEEGPKIYSSSQIEIGDICRIKFAKAQFLVLKIPTAMKSIKFKDKKNHYIINHINFVGYEINPIYTGILKSKKNKNKIIVRFTFKSGVIHLSDDLIEENYLYYDQKNKKIVEDNGANNVQIKSIYVKEN